MNGIFGKAIRDAIDDSGVLRAQGITEYRIIRVGNYIIPRRDNTFGVTVCHAPVEGHDVSVLAVTFGCRTLESSVRIVAMIEGEKDYGDAKDFGDGVIDMSEVRTAIRREVNAALAQCSPAAFVLRHLGERTIFQNDDYIEMRVAALTTAKECNIKVYKAAYVFQSGSVSLFCDAVATLSRGVLTDCLLNTAQMTEAEARVLIQSLIDESGLGTEGAA